MLNRHMNIYLPAEEISFLVITSREFAWVSNLRDISNHVHIAQSEQDLLDSLMNHEYNIIFYDEATFNDPTTDIVNEITQQATTAAISVISDDLGEDHYKDLIAAGASDIISSDIVVDNLMQRITPMLNQSKKNRVLAERTRKLHATNLLAHKLHNSEHPTTLIVETIDWICTYFDVYGVAITLDKGSNLHLYAGTRDTNNRRRIYESTAEMRPYDPLLQVITSGVSLIVADITRHPEFVPIPVIQDPKSTIIVPLKQGLQTIGSLALFAKDVAFTSDDLATFELLAVHFLTAYINVRDNVWREADVQSMRQVLRAWPALNTAYSATEIASTLHKFVGEIESAQVVAVWLFHPEGADHEGAIYSSSTKLQYALNEMDANQELQGLISEFDNGMQPITFHKRLAKTEVLVKLYDAMETNQITILPIAGSSSFEGAIFVGNKLNQSVTNADLSLIENLARVAANVIERNMLIDELQEQKGRLQEQTGRIEGVLRSIREGIFFVDEDGNVVYSNPQFSELTNISPSTVMNQSYKELFKHLSEKSSERQHTMTQLSQAFEQIISGDEDDNYPIVEIRNAPDTNILVEFMRMDNAPDQASWVGVIRSNEVQSHVVQSNGRSEMLQEMLEDIGIPLTALNKTTMLLSEQHDYLSPQRFGPMLEDVDQQVQHIQSMWANFLQIYRGETGGINLHTTSVNPVDFLSELLTTRRMYAYQRHIRFTESTIKASVDLDERLMRQSLINLVDFMVSVSNYGAPIFVNIAPEGQSNLLISLHEKTTHVSEEMMTSILEPSNPEIGNNDIIRYRLGIFLAKQIVDAHGGNLSVVSGRGMGLTVKLQLPIANLESIGDTLDETEVSITQSDKKLNIVVLESNAKYLAGMYPKLEVDGHTIIPEFRIDDVMLDLGAMKVDVIMIEANRPHAGLVANCQRIRAQSEAPIIILAAEELESECLQCLGSGADDYFLAPINEEKLGAQLQSLSKRHQIASRTAEPIVVGDLVIDFSRRRVTLKDKLLNLTAKEYDLLRVLAMNRGQVITHQQLLTKVWGPEYRDETQYLWVNISRLRRKLKPKKADPQYIHNEQGVGYIFEYEEEYKKSRA